ncbi:hypothetical protein B0G81_3298 [Paraburkholderia sp. BL6665CI2N2]|nr:hypothetical protein B0G81_3298 [Paraburkholderia sp. BL6665CI2N2]
MLFKNGQQIGNAYIGQLFGKHIPEDQIAHSTRIFGRSPLTRADDGIGRLGSGTNDCLNFFYTHECVIGYVQDLFSPAR